MSNDLLKMLCNGFEKLRAHSLTRAVLVVGIFHIVVVVVVGGWGGYAPSNSAPELRSDIQQAAFESS